MYNLTESQKDSLRWIIREIRAENLREEFDVIWTHQGAYVYPLGQKYGDTPSIPLTPGVIQALEEDGFLVTAQYKRMGSDVF